jgi:hypothetical protein
VPAVSAFLWELDLHLPAVARSEIFAASPPLKEGAKPLNAELAQPPRLPASPTKSHKSASRTRLAHARGQGVGDAVAEDVLEGDLACPSYTTALRSGPSRCHRDRHFRQLRR